MKAGLKIPNNVERKKNSQKSHFLEKNKICAFKDGNVLKVLKSWLPTPQKVTMLSITHYMPSRSQQDHCLSACFSHKQLQDMQ